MNAAEKLMLTMNQELENKPFKSITVTRICQLSNVSRPTFYHHYNTLSDLACKSMNYRLFNDIYDFKTWEDWIDCAEKVILYMRDHKGFFINAFCPQVLQAGTRYFDRIISDYIERRQTAFDCRLKNEDKAFISHIFSGIIVSLFNEYTKAEMSIDPDFLSSQVSSLLDGSVDRAIRGCIDVK